MLAHPSDEVREAAAGAAGQCIIWSEDPALMLQKEILSVGPGAEWAARQGAVLALATVLADEKMADITAALTQPITSAINDCVQDARGPVRAAIADHLLHHRTHVVGTSIGKERGFDQQGFDLVGEMGLL